MRTSGARESEVGSASQASTAVATKVVRSMCGVVRPTVTGDELRLACLPISDYLDNRNEI